MHLNGLGWYLFSIHPSLPAIWHLLVIIVGTIVAWYLLCCVSSCPPPWFLICCYLCCWIWGWFWVARSKNSFNSKADSSQACYDWACSSLTAADFLAEFYNLFSLILITWTYQFLASHKARSLALGSLVELCPTAFFFHNILHRILKY